MGRAAEEELGEQEPRLVEMEGKADSPEVVAVAVAVVPQAQVEQVAPVLPVVLP